MAISGINRTLQENLVTLLCHDDEHGKIVANLIDPTIFEGELRIIAERSVAYWKSHNQAPKAHTSDLVADILEDRENKKAPTVRRLLIDMLQLSESINTVYVIDQIRAFTRAQRQKQAIFKGAQLLNTKQELAIPEVDAIFNEVLRSRELTFNPGMRLFEYERVLSFLQQRHSEFSTGIKELDERSCIPARGAVGIFLAPTGRGKTWWLINIGKQAIKQRKKIVHITLELSEEETAQRYLQAFFAIPKHDAEMMRTTLLKDRLGRFADIKSEKFKAEFTFDSPLIADELQIRLDHFGTRFNNLIIKKFPMRSLSMDGLRAYLDNLEVTEKFIPDMVILDYFGVMKVDTKDFRISLGRAFEDFKGLCEERNVSGETAQQVSRVGAQSNNVVMTQISEDWSLTNTADVVRTFTSTDAEFERGLGRIYVNKARSETDKYGVLITQNYATGQFALDSMLLEKKYFEAMQEFTKSEDEDEGDGDED